MTFHLTLADCPGFAPGIALPLGICERCGSPRSAHAPEARALPTAHLMMDAVTQPTPPTPLIPKPERTVLYCRQCSAGMVLGPDVDADSYACPKCGATGAKTLAPVPVAKPSRLESPAVVKPSDMQQRLMDAHNALLAQATAYAGIDLGAAQIESAPEESNAQSS